MQPRGWHKSQEPSRTIQNARRTVASNLATVYTKSGRPGLWLERQVADNDDGIPVSPTKATEAVMAADLTARQLKVALAGYPQDLWVWQEA